MNGMLKDELDHLLMLSLENVITEEQICDLHRLIHQEVEAVHYCMGFLNVASCLRKSNGRIIDFLSSESFEDVEAKQVLSETIEQDEKIRSEKAAQEAYRQALAQKAKVEKEAEAAFKKFQEEERHRQEKLAYLRYRKRQRMLVLGIAGLAASLALVVGLWILHRNPQPPEPVVPAAVASISDSLNARWSDPKISTRTGAQLISGPMSLTQGFVEISFGKGAKIVLEAPAAIDLEDTNHMTMRAGRLSARVPPEAYGFVVDTPNASFMDIGTEFGVNVTKDGQSEVQVFQGEVVLFAGRNIQAKRIRQTVKAGEAKRVHVLDAGISNIPWQQKSYMRHVPSAYELAVRTSQPMSYWRFVPNDTNNLIDILNQTRNDIETFGHVGYTKGPPLSKNKDIHALQFKGDGSYAYIPKMGASLESNPREYTYIFWFRTESIRAQDILVETNEGTIQYRHLGMTEEGRLVHLAYNFKGRKIKDTFYSQVRIQPGQWYHVALTGKLNYGKGIINLYINGREEISQPVINTFAPKFRGHIYLGSAPEAGKVLRLSSLQGAIAEIAQYNRALSPKEIIQLYLSSQ